MVTARVVCNSKQAIGEGADRVVTVRFSADHRDEASEKTGLSLSLKAGSFADRFEVDQVYALSFVTAHASEE